MSKRMKDKIYLGDAVYAAQDGYHIWLWTSDGIKDSQPIALEPAVLDALFSYRSNLLARVRVARSYQIDARTGAEGWGAATPIGWRNVTPTHWQPLPAPPSDEPGVSPELRDHPPRERVEAERDIAVAAINTIRFKGSPHETWARSIADSAAAKIAALRGQEPPR